MQVYNYVLDRCTLGISDVDKNNLLSCKWGGFGGPEYYKVALCESSTGYINFYHTMHVHYNA